MRRVIILLLDSLGIGYTEDSDKYGDRGANTLGHIVERYPEIEMSNLSRLGLLDLLKSSSGLDYTNKRDRGIENTIYGYAQEISRGKDTISGHWELMGCPVDFDWGYFREREGESLFPKDLLDILVRECGLSGYLGNCLGSGTELIDRYGEEHIKTKKPIFYSSADSVFQIAVNEEVFGLDRLYRLCEVAREELYSYNIGRVIARPFEGRVLGEFKRTGNRKDYAILPHRLTLLDKVKESGMSVTGIGKISDIFGGRGITRHVKSSRLEKLCEDTINEIKENKDRGIIFTNFVDFDSEYGHRRDIRGYKEAIEYFDRRLGEIVELIGEEDLLVIISDHGCDPTWRGNDHTREHIPIIFYNRRFRSRYIGKRGSFSDVGQTIGNYLKIEPMGYGKSFLKEE